MAIKSYTENNGKMYEVYVNGYNARGARIQKRKRGIDTLRKAQTIEFEFKREMARFKEENVSYRWEEWLLECIKRMKMVHRNSTIVAYEKTLGKWITPLWIGMELPQINKQLVYKALFEDIGDKVSPWTRKSILKLIRRVFEMALEDGILTRNPCTGLSVQVAEVEQKVLTNSEVVTFLKTAKTIGHRFYPMWAMALMTGMRSGEMFALRWSDVDLEGRLIHVSRAWNSKNGFTPTKTQRSRIVPISDDLLKFLKELKLKTGKESEFVLPQIPEWVNGEQALITREFCESIGVTSVKFHDLRATFITNLLARGESLARVMSMVGHSQLKTTNGYLRKAGVDVQGGTDRLGYTLPDDSLEGKILSLTTSR